MVVVDLHLIVHSAKRDAINNPNLQVQNVSPKVVRAPCNTLSFATLVCSTRVGSPPRHAKSLAYQKFLSRDSCCDATTFTAGVDDLLENTNRALGLTLKRGEATALISMLDVNGDKSIQCAELEVPFTAGNVAPMFLWKLGDCGRHQNVWRGRI